MSRRSAAAGRVGASGGPPAPRAAGPDAAAAAEAEAAAEAPSGRRPEPQPPLPEGGMPRGGGDVGGGGLIPSCIRIHSGGGSAAAAAAAAESAGQFCRRVRRGRFLFALVASYTATCEIPGISCAGAGPGLMHLTPPADAELLHYGHCPSLGPSAVPSTPDGKPTPALLTRAALVSASIPHVVVNAGCAEPPRLPYIEAALPAGRNIAVEPAMSESDALRAVDYGRIIGRTLSSLADCVVIGETVPGGTTTALAVMRGLGMASASTSSSMPENPVGLKEQVVAEAMRRAGLPGRRADAFAVAAELGDPMIPTVAGMLGAASESSAVLLAGGTQMAAVLALARASGCNLSNTAVGTTAYVTGDATATMVQSVAEATSGTVPVLAVDPGLGSSAEPQLRAYAGGFAKEGAGAGGALIAAALRTGAGSGGLLRAVEREYGRSR